MIKVIENLLQDFSYHAQTCELEVCYEDKLCKVKRMEYLPDEDGKVIFYKEGVWTNDGFTIVEMTEFLNKFGEQITDILFEAYDGSYQPYINSVEVQVSGSGIEYHLRLLVGEDRPLTFTDNVVYNNQVPIVPIF